MTNTPFCIDCPDREACATGYPCDLVKRINARAAKGRAIRGEQIANGMKVADDPIDYLDPVPLHNELDRLRTENERLRGESTCERITAHTGEHGDIVTGSCERSENAERRLEVAGARVDQLSDELALTRDTLTHRTRALNETGATNDTLRAKLAAITAQRDRLRDQLQHECPHGEMSWSGLDQTPLDDPAKVWVCDNCGKTLDADDPGPVS